MQGIPKIRHWLPVAHPPALRPGGLHLWRIRSGAKGAPLAPLWSLLSPHELERARKLRFDQHRERYVRSHAGLRTILSSYINIHPQAIVFSHSGAGKPVLDSNAAGVDFNLTTSGDLALVAVSIGEPIGVDCEQFRDHRNVVAIARRMFSPEAASQIAAMASAERLERFHIAWTALEAEVKVDGRGLFGRKRPSALGSVQISHCMPEPGFIAAVARKRLPPVEDWVTLELSAG